MPDKLVPANIEAEQATLGSCLLDRDAIVPIAAWLQADHFWVDAHAWVYAAMQRCYAERRPIDIQTIADELRRRGQLGAVGGVPFLIGLSNGVPTAYHVEHYARIVEQTATLRGLIRASAEIARLAFDERDDVGDTLDAAEQTLFAVTQRSRQTDFVPLSTIVDEYLAKLDAAQGEPERLRPLGTGLADLDHLIGGLFGGDVLCIAARPGVGKSALAMSVALYVATQPHAVGYFSVEMGRDQLLLRCIAALTGIDVQRLRTSVDLDLDELQRVVDAAGRLAERALYIDDTSGITLQALRAKARRLVMERDAKLLIVDYVQLVTTGRRSDNRQQEVGELSRGLKQLARELNVPLIMLSQLNRDVEKRTSKVPVLSDLREAGDLEQDSDLVAFIHRPAMYDDDQKPSTGELEQAELHVAKHRNGPLGMVPLWYDAQTTTFKNKARFSTPEGY